MSDNISRQAAIDKFIDGIAEIFADIRERHVDDSVCGLCEYDGAYLGQSGDWCNECPGFEKDDCFKLSDKIRKEWADEIIKALPSADPNAIQRIQRVGSVDLISRQAVLDFPIRIDHYDEEHGNRDFVLGIESVMEYVESLPSAEPKEVYCPMASRTCFANGKVVAWCLTCPHISEEDRELVKKAVEGSQPKTGHWVWNPDGMDWNIGAWVCSECRHKPETWWECDERHNPLNCAGSHFCGNCGADMRGENDAG